MHAKPLPLPRRAALILPLAAALPSRARAAVAPFLAAPSS